MLSRSTIRIACVLWPRLAPTSRKHESGGNVNMRSATKSRSNGRRSTFRTVRIAANFASIKEGKSTCTVRRTFEGAQAFALEGRRQLATEVCRSFFAEMFLVREMVLRRHPFAGLDVFAAGFDDQRVHMIPHLRPDRQRVIEIAMLLRDRHLDENDLNPVVARELWKTHPPEYTSAPNQPVLPRHKRTASCSCRTSGAM